MCDPGLGDEPHVGPDPRLAGRCCLLGLLDSPWALALCRRPRWAQSTPGAEEGRQRQEV